MDKIELLKKIKNLADGGVGGEKENAQQRLEELMAKYNISEQDLELDIIKEFDINAKSDIERRLLNQVAYSVYGDIDERKGVYKYTHLKHKFCIKCTDAEFIEIKSKFDFYKREYYKQMKVFVSAFINVQGLFPDESLTKPKETKNKFFLSDEEIKIVNMAAGIDRADFRKQIGGKDEE